MEDAASAGKQQPAAGAAPGAQAAPAGGGAAGGAANPQQAASAEGGAPQNGSGRPQVPTPLHPPVRGWTLARSMLCTSSTVFLACVRNQLRSCGSAVGSHYQQRQLLSAHRASVTVFIARTVRCERVRTALIQQALQACSY